MLTKYLNKQILSSKNDMMKSIELFSQHHNIKSKLNAISNWSLMISKEMNPYSLQPLDTGRSRYIQVNMNSQVRIHIDLIFCFVDAEVNNWPSICQTCMLKLQFSLLLTQNFWDYKKSYKLIINRIREYDRENFKVWFHNIKIILSINKTHFFWFKQLI